MTNIDLAQKFQEPNADFEYIRYVFLISIINFLTRKIAKTHIILARNFKKNYSDFSKCAMYF
jgi:hypothetical protein